MVAVLDTGTTQHPELAGHMLPGFDFVSDSGYANDGDGRDADPSDPGDWVSAADRSADAARFGSCDVEDSTWHGTVIAGMLAAKTNNRRRRRGDELERSRAARARGRQVRCRPRRHR